MARMRIELGRGISIEAPQDIDDECRYGRRIQ